MGSQIATPEEVVTVPIATFLGGAIGYMSGRKITEMTYELIYERGASVGN